MAVKWTRNDAGYDVLRTGPMADGLVAGYAARLEAGANAIPSTTTPAATEPYYVTDEASDENRSRRRVRTDGLRAIKHDAKTDALLRALSGLGSSG